MSGMKDEPVLSITKYANGVAIGVAMEGEKGSQVYLGFEKLKIMHEHLSGIIDVIEAEQEVGGTIQ